MQSFQQISRTIPIEQFTQRSNLAAWNMLLVNYFLIAFAFALPILAGSYWWGIVSLVLLGNRQLGLGIMMHDCAHNAFFKSKRLNEFVGEWLFAAPILAQLHGYRSYHLKHHAKAGTTEDPDYVNYRAYPVSKQSVYRKFARDILGITGIKNLGLVLAMHAGFVEYDMAYKSNEKANRRNVWFHLRSLTRNLYQAVVFHVLLAVVLYSMGHIALYALWWVAYLTTFSLFSRVRNAAEHAGVPDLLDKDPRLHARTVYAGWLAKLTVAPNHVNYHIEHHWMPQVPPYRLAALHQYLKNNNALEGVEVLPDYWAVLRKLA